MGFYTLRYYCGSLVLIRCVHVFSAPRSDAEHLLNHVDSFKSHTLSQVYSKDAEQRLNSHIRMLKSKLALYAEVIMMMITHSFSSRGYYKGQGLDEQRDEYKIRMGQQTHSVSSSSTNSLQTVRPYARS